MTLKARWRIIIKPSALIRKGALEDFNKAIELKADYADAFVNRGKAKSNLGDNDGACEDWQKAYKFGLEEARDLIAKYCKK